MVFFAGGPAGVYWPGIQEILETHLPSSQIVTCAPDEQLLSHTAKNCSPDSLITASEPSTAWPFKAGLRDAEDARALIFYLPAQNAIAHELMSGTSPEDALDNWTKNAESVLAVFRANRARCILINAHEALNAPNTFQDVLTKQLGASNIDAANPISALPASDEILSVFAANIVNDATDLLPLATELRASSIDLGGGQQDAQTAIAHGLSALRDLRINLDTYLLENKNAAAEIKQIAELSEATLKELQTNARNDIEAKENEITEKAREISSLSNENSLLQRQLTLLQRRVETETSNLHASGQVASNLTTKIARLSRERDQLRADLIQRDKDLTKIRSSASWKFAAPVRLLSRSFALFSSNERGLRKQIALVRNSKLFNQKWYEEQYPDIKESGADPVEHYVRYGWKEGRAAGPDFSSSAYLERYPDVAVSNINPLAHYLQSGRAEGREISAIDETLTN